MIVLLALALTAQLSTSPTPGIALPSPTPEPKVIFSRALQKVATYPLPPYAVYSTTWQIDTHTKAGVVSGVAHHRYAERTRDDLENSSSGASVPKTLPPAAVLPVFVGAFAWRSAPQAAGTKTGLSAPELPTSLKTIAVVTVGNSAYTITIAGVDSIAGHRAYHLVLRANFDPARHNLHDLWVDVDSYDVWKAHYTGTYLLSDQAPGPRPSDVTLLFLPMAGYWVAVESVFTYRAYPDSDAYVFDVRKDQIAFPAQLPDWLFDITEYEKHQLAGEPDVIGPLLAR